jgi:hypothetical protein
MAKQLSLAQWGLVVQRQQLQPRSALEAQLHWRNAACPALRQGEFSAEEDEELMALVEQLGTRQVGGGGLG